MLRHVPIDRNQEAPAPAASDHIAPIATADRLSHTAVMPIEPLAASTSASRAINHDTNHTVQSDSALPLGSLLNGPSPLPSDATTPQKHTPQFANLNLISCESRQSLLEKLTTQDLACLVQAANALRADCLTAGMSKDPATLNAQWFDAAGRNDTDTISVLLEAGFDRNTLDHDRKTAIYYAAGNGNLEATKLLLDPVGDGLGVTTVDGASGASHLLHYFASWGHATAVSTLIAAGCHPDSMESGKTALMAAIEVGKEECIRTLLDAGASVNGTNTPGNDSPLSIAVREKRNTVVQMLLQKPGINLTNYDSEGLTPVGRAKQDCLYDRLEPNMLELFKEHMAKREHPEARAWTRAAVAGDISTLTDIHSRHGSDFVDAYSPGSNSALHFASMNDRQEAAALLLSWGADPGAHVGDGMTPTGVAVTKGHAGMVALLLKIPQNLDVLDVWGTSVLLKAVAMKRADIVSLLLIAGASANLPENRHQETPLHAAAWNGDTATLRLLLQHGGDLRALNKGGLTPLDRARLSGSAETVSVIEDHLRNTEASRA